MNTQKIKNHFIDMECELVDSELNIYDREDYIGSFNIPNLCKYGLPSYNKFTYIQPGVMTYKLPSKVCQYVKELQYSYLKRAFKQLKLTKHGRVRF